MTDVETFTSDEQVLSYRIVGNGPCVVTGLHPLALHGRWYLDLAAATGDSYTWVLPDFPGHGLSPEPVEPVTLTGLADQIITLWDHLGVTSSAVLGVSLGGMVAQALTDRARDRVWAQVLMCTAHAFPETGLAGARARVAATRQAADMGALADATLARWFTSDQIAENHRLVDRARRDLQSGTVATHADYLEAMLGLGFVGTSQSWSPPPPTLAVAGRGDQSTPSIVMEGLAAAIDQAELTAIPGGHLAPFEHPAATARILDHFFGQHCLEQDRSNLHR